GDDADDEDEDEEDEEDEEEQHLAPTESAIVIPTDGIISPLELGLLSDFRLPYPFHQRQRLRDFLKDMYFSQTHKKWDRDLHRKSPRKETKNWLD
nr:hypothetical protein [Tanacetum cinerariifolium]